MSAAGQSLRDLVPLARVSDIKRSIEFYSQLGFQVMGKYEPEGKLSWVHLQSGGADLMLTAASKTVDSEEQGVLFYLYVSGVAAFREQLARQGLKVGELEYFFFAKDGEFKVVDPDGYVLLISQVSA